MILFEIFFDEGLVDLDDEADKEKLDEMISK
jgi:hypothetical protein